MKHALCYTGPLSLGVPFQRFGGPGAGNFRKQKLAMATVEEGEEGRKAASGRSALTLGFIEKPL